MVLFVVVTLCFIHFFRFIQHFRRDMCGHRSKRHAEAFNQPFIPLLMTDMVQLLSSGIVLLDGRRISVLRR